MKKGTKINRPQIFTKNLAFTLRPSDDEKLREEAKSLSISVSELIRIKLNIN